MKKRIWPAVALLFALIAWSLGGCAVTGEETADTAEYIEGVHPDAAQSGNMPAKLEAPGRETAAGDAPQQREESEEPSAESGNGDAGPPNMAPPAEETDETDPEILRFISYNIGNEQDGNGQPVSARAPLLKEVIDCYQPDVFGVQEAVSEWRNYLTQYFGGQYDALMQCQAENEDEAIAIFWRKDRLSCMESGYFWLSEHPERPAAGWDGTRPRVCVWAQLKDLRTGKIFLYYNTQFDTPETCQIGSVELIVKKAAEQGDYPVFCAGNLCVEEQVWGTSYTFWQKGFMLISQEFSAEPGPTLHRYQPGGITADHCFYQEMRSIVEDFKVVDDRPQGGYISDHYGIYWAITLV